MNLFVEEYQDKLIDILNNQERFHEIKIFLNWINDISKEDSEETLLLDENYLSMVWVI